VIALSQILSNFKYDMEECDFESKRRTTAFIMRRGKKRITKKYMWKRMSKEAGDRCMRSIKTKE